MGETQNPVTCPYCGMKAPAENLLCIYCGQSLNLRSGFGRGTWFVLVTGGLIAALIIWLL